MSDQPRDDKVLILSNRLHQFLKTRGKAYSCSRRDRCVCMSDHGYDQSVGQFDADDIFEAQYQSNEISAFDIQETVMPDSRPWYKFINIYIASCLLQLVGAAGLVTLYVILHRLYATYPDQPGLVGWSIVSYLLVSAILGTICGRLGDLLGRRFIVCCMLMIAMSGALLSELAPNLLILVVGAGLQGSASALTPLALGMLREYLPQRLVPVAVGIVTATGSGGAGFLFIAVGMVVDAYGINGGFIFKVVLSVLAFIITIVCLPRSAERPRSMHRIDFIRGILFAPAIAGKNYGQG